MDLKSSYLVIVDRSIKGADSDIQSSLHEHAAFHAYHAFESLGGAFCASVNASYPRGSHKKKLNKFVKEARRYRNSFHYEIARLAIILASTRNETLYPRESLSQSYISPRDSIDIISAARLVKSVKGVCNRVQRFL